MKHETRVVGACEKLGTARVWSAGGGAFSEPVRAARQDLLTGVT